KSGKPREGLSEIEAALSIVEKNQARFQLSEIQRLKGELLLMLPGYDIDVVVACFRDALATARAQGAPLLQLRAATSLARALIHVRRHAEARRLLADVCSIGAIAESPELHEARALLAE